jgi:hypothetical protein
MTNATLVSDAGHEQDLLGQTVVVIGRSSGIGLETARMRPLTSRRWRCTS